MEPERAVAQAYAEILLREAEGPHALDQERDQLDLRLGAAFPEHVRVQLGERAPAPLLHPLMPVEFADAVPLDRALEGPGPLPDQAADAGRHLRPQGHLAPSPVREREELALQLAAGLGPVQVQ